VALGGQGRATFAVAGSVLGGQAKILVFLRDMDRYGFHDVLAGRRSPRAAFRDQPHWRHRGKLEDFTSRATGSAYARPLSVIMTGVGCRKTGWVIARRIAGIT
jgi:hypothetical protein